MRLIPRVDFERAEPRSTAQFSVHVNLNFKSPLADEISGEAQFEQIEFLVRHLKSGQADPELIDALRAFNGEIAAQGTLRQRSTDSDGQGKTGLTARAMRLADDLFAHLSQIQRDRITWNMAVYDGLPRPLEGRQN